MSSVRRRPTALLGSVVLHATVVAWLWTRTFPAPRIETKPAHIAVRLEERATPPPQPAPQLPVPPRPQRRASQATPPRAPAETVTPAPPPVEPPAEIVAPRVPIEPPGETTPGPAQPPKIDLFARDALRGGLTIPVPKETPGPRQLGVLPGERAGDDATTEAGRVAARVGAAGIDQAARARVRAGIVDPSYARLGRALLEAWDPDRALPETTAELWAKRRAQNAVVGMKLWQEAAANYAQTGTPLADGETLEDTPDSTTRDVNAPVPGLDARRTRDVYRNYMRGKFNEGRSALVLVEHEPDGKVNVSLVQSSGDPQIDHAAVEDIRAAMARMAAAGAPFSGARRSLWSLRLQIIINPPVPMLGMTFDEVLETPKLELPLGRKLLKRVQLEAVYDDDPRLTGDGVPPPDTVQAIE